MKAIGLTPPELALARLLVAEEMVRRTDDLRSLAKSLPHNPDALVTAKERVTECIALLSKLMRVRPAPRAAS